MTDGASAGYEILEHTADVGIRAWGPTLEDVFQQAGWGLADILGALPPSGSSGAEAEADVTATASDRGALLVDFLNELLLLHETGEVALASIEVVELTDTSLRATLRLTPLEGETETTGVKAATYHRLEIRSTDGGHEARVYLDV